MFANCFDVFRTRATMQCAVGKDEHEQTETKTAAILVFGFQKK